MRLLRIGNVGHEQPVVMDASNASFEVPASYGDFNGSFFESGAVDELRQALSKETLAPFDITGKRIGAPIARPGKIVCIGLNYRDHAEETGLAIPEEPVVFLKAPNCMVGPNDDVMIPRASTKCDWEIELAVVISKTARYLDSVEQAADHIAGYALANDMSERVFQMERGGQWDKGKSCETFNPLGPWLATPDEIASSSDLSLTLKVNGVTRQDSNTKHMIFNVNYIIWYLSQFMVLEAGDLINTGTPAGVSFGHDDVPFLTAGDVLDLGISGLGTQTNRLVQA
jgi:2-keto-4-pentenoate hydratase/2-oxohepta-3-ene-1,7-dioic acid hydratase in catechol pathway